MQALQMILKQRSRKQRKKTYLEIMATLPVRKPLAVSVALFSIALVFYSMYRGIDIPQGVLQLSQTIIFTFGGGYIASSTLEHNKGVELYKDEETTPNSNINHT